MKSYNTSLDLILIFTEKMQKNSYAIKAAADHESYPDLSSQCPMKRGEV